MSGTVLNDLFTISINSPQAPRGGKGRLQGCSMLKNGCNTLLFFPLRNRVKFPFFESKLS